MNEWTIENLQVGECYACAIGRWDERTNMWNVNYSDILTRLIQEAGKHCKYYASDLFIDWATICKKLENPECEDEAFVFGFVENGIDNKEIVEEQMNENGAFMLRYYKSVWLLTIAKTKHEHLRMRLYPASL